MGKPFGYARVAVAATAHYTPHTLFSGTRKALHRRGFDICIQASVIAMHGVVGPFDGVGEIARVERDCVTSDVARFYYRHLLGICWYEYMLNDAGEYSGVPNYRVASGFLMELDESLHGCLVLVTAGHVFIEYERRRSDARLVARKHSLFDNWGLSSRGDHRLPFDLFTSPAMVEFDTQRGVDFAVVYLPDYVRKWVSRTTTPFTSATYTCGSDVEFDSFLMLGAPSERAEQVTRREDGVESLTTYQDPEWLELKPCDPPSGLEPTIYPQFVAKIDPEADLRNIQGMSGGPIIGFRRSPDGQLRYWLVAIQRRWFERQRIVIGTLIAPMIASIKTGIEQFLAQDLA